MRKKRFGVKLLRPDDTSGSDRALRWGEGVTHEVEGQLILCSSGALHAYPCAELAVFMDPCHGQYGRTAIARRVECWEPIISDGTKWGCQKQTTRKKVPLVWPSIEQLVAFAIFCAYGQKPKNEWAIRWLSGEDRSVEAAAAGAVTGPEAWAAEEAAAAAEAAAARAAAAAAEEEAAAARAAAEAHLIACAKAALAWKDPVNVG